MQMLYNSENFTVVAFEVPSQDEAMKGVPGTSRDGYEIVNKLSRKGTFIEGVLAESFQQGIQALVDQGPDEEAMQDALDDYIAAYTTLAQQPLVLH